MGLYPKRQGFCAWRRCLRRLGTPLLAPAAEVEQHLQQVGVVDDAVPVEVFVAVAAPAEPV
jgi:hypothetical protein